jgi:fructosamine-3-kinase
VEARLGAVGAVLPVGGGSISAAWRVELPGGPVFVKHNGSAPPGFFPAEARGLAALREAAAGALHVPRVLAVFDAVAEGAAGEPSWLALEWVEPGPRRDEGFGERLGRGVAALHARRDGGWGAGEDNFIGELPQENGPVGSWAAFWRARRLEPQLRWARDAGRMPGRAGDWDALFARLDDALAPAEEDGPSLLHGDLWSGNVLRGPGGEPVLVDPAAYRGHREVDLAMAELFGGFDGRFHAAYREARPLLPGYAETRRPIYQLFYLLVHVNVFGGGYVERTAEVLREALRG